ncbi:MAG: hypothetical protein A07HR60_02165, partial [uncultured archaeon A07HR60]
MRTTSGFETLTALKSGFPLVIRRLQTSELPRPARADALAEGGASC